MRYAILITMMLAVPWGGEGFAAKEPLGAKRAGMATYIFRGRVIEVERETKILKRFNYKYEYVYYTATIVVDRMIKAERHGTARRLRVRSWKSKYLGPGPQPAGLGGHSHVPEKGEVVKVYARRAGKHLNVLDPDGYLLLKEAPKPEEEEAPKPEEEEDAVEKTGKGGAEAAEPAQE